MSSTGYKIFPPALRVLVVVILALCSLLHFLSVEKIYLAAAREVLGMLLH